MGARKKDKKVWKDYQRENRIKEAWLERKKKNGTYIEPLKPDLISKKVFIKMFEENETEITCSTFGCGKILSYHEKLFGDKCWACSVNKNDTVFR